jgi:hypothetical protein
MLALIVSGRRQVKRMDVYLQPVSRPIAMERYFSPSWSLKEGNVSWILKKYDISIVKDIILSVKEPTL